MEEGAFRCDANISIRSTDGSVVGRKVEIKNMNSFRAVERALRYEEQRQREAIVRDGSIPQETRGWIEARGITVSQRTKEQAHDYRYFPEPDLPPLHVDAAWIAEVRERLPELPAARFERFVRDYGLSPDDAGTLTAEHGLADQFEEAVGGERAMARGVANWIINDGLGLARARGLDADQLPFTPAQIRELMAAVAGGELTMRAAKELLPQLETGESPRAAAARLNLLSLDDTAAVKEAVASTLAAHPAAVADYRGGKKAAIGRLIGETIKATGGRANPDTVRTLLVEALEAPEE
jgi:aspartyl-tRNA(Asn)/glutamyl-tRNA(Gln) amidotransferase subunit B